MHEYLRVDKIDKLIKGKIVTWLTKKCNIYACLNPCVVSIRNLEHLLGTEGVSQYPT